MKTKYKGCDIDQIRWGSCDDPRDVLKIGEEYEIEYLQMHSQHTKVKLVDIDGLFPSVGFTITDQTLWRQASREYDSRKGILSDMNINHMGRKKKESQNDE